MPLVIPPNAGHAQIYIVGGPSDPMMVTFGFELAEVGGPGSATAAAEQIFDSIVSALQPQDFLGGDLIMNQVDVTMDGGGGLEQGSHFGSHSWSNFAMAPPNVALLVRKNNNGLGRRNQSRFYWPGVTESASDNDGLIDAGTLGIMQSNFNDWYSSLVSLEIVPAVLHNEPPSPAPPPTHVTGFGVQNRVATQRRRLR